MRVRWVFLKIQMERYGIAIEPFQVQMQENYIKLIKDRLCGGWCWFRIVSDCKLMYERCWYFGICQQVISHMEMYIMDKCISLSLSFSFSYGLRGDTQSSYIGLESRIVKPLYRYENILLFWYWQIFYGQENRHWLLSCVIGVGFHTSSQDTFPNKLWYLRKLSS